MIKSPAIKVNPDVLKTLRESTGYTVEEIARKIKTTAKVAERLQAHYPSRRWQGN